jgi:uncharacterized protein involved in response to NO
LGSLHAALLIPLWLLMLIADLRPVGPFDAMQWHAHEMVFGYLAAIVAGFVLTAVPNWTGRLPLSGAPLAGLVGLWLAGRLATGFMAPPVAAAIIDVAFLTLLAASVWREIVVGRNWRNTPVALMLSLLACANLLHHLEAAGWGEPGFAIRLALGAIVVLMALIGGRIVPSFTRNWLARQAGQPMPASFGRVDKLALVVTILAAVGWLFWPHHAVTAGLLIGGGALLCVRLSRWRTLATLREPIVAILHLGYGWLALSLMLMGAAIAWPDAIAPSAALHALTAGAVGTMTLAVMTRASLGHTGRRDQCRRMDGYHLFLRHGRGTSAPRRRFRAGLPSSPACRRWAGLEPRLPSLRDALRPHAGATETVIMAGDFDEHEVDIRPGYADRHGDAPLACHAGGHDAASDAVRWLPDRRVSHSAGSMPGTRARRGDTCRGTRDSN